MDEQWVDVPGYPYEVSDHGRVRRTKTVPQSPAGRFLGYRTSWGYTKVSLCLAGHRREEFAHRLVAMAFIPNPRNLPEINHIDGDKLNNQVSNLEWVTNLQNARHAYRSGLMAVGERHANAKLTDATVRTARARYSDGDTMRVIACEYGVHVNTIIRAVNGETWKHLRPAEEG